MTQHEFYEIMRRIAITQNIKVDSQREALVFSKQFQKVANLEGLEPPTQSFKPQDYGAPPMLNNPQNTQGGHPLQGNHFQGQQQNQQAYLNQQKPQAGFGQQQPGGGGFNNNNKRNSNFGNANPGNQSMGGGFTQTDFEGGFS